MRDGLGQFSHQGITHIVVRLAELKECVVGKRDHFRFLQGNTGGRRSLIADKGRPGQNITGPKCHHPYLTTTGDKHIQPHMAAGDQEQLTATFTFPAEKLP